MKYTTKSANLSEDRQFRYRLTREWEDGKGSCVFIGLNPSTADAMEDDPTIRRCVSFAAGWGFRKLVMINLFAFRATDPKELKKSTDIFGTCNDELVLDVVLNADLVVAAWGAGGGHLGQDKAMLYLLRGYDIHHLGLTKEGHPRHPLYLKSDTKPTLWRPRRRF